VNLETTATICGRSFSDRGTVNHVDVEIDLTHDGRRWLRYVAVRV